MNDTRQPQNLALNIKKTGKTGGVMRKALVVFATGLSFATLCAAAGAQQLPKSGSINFHTGWKNSVEAITPADKHMLGHGGVVGTTFNDKGSGPLHLGPADC